LKRTGGKRRLAYTVINSELKTDSLNKGLATYVSDPADSQIMINGVSPDGSSDTSSYGGILNLSLALAFTIIALLFWKKS